MKGQTTKAGKILDPVRGIRGVTLIEVMISLSLLAVGVLALVSSQAGISRSLARARSYTELGAAASQALEEGRRSSCVAGGSDSGSVGGAATWQSTAVAPGLSRLEVRLQPGGLGLRTPVIRSFIWCRT